MLHICIYIECGKCGCKYCPECHNGCPQCRLGEKTVGGGSTTIEGAYFGNNLK